MTQVCWLQHCHHEPPCVKAAVRDDPRTRRLAETLAECSGEWSPRAVGNVAWAHAVLGHGPANLLDMVRPWSPQAGVLLCGCLWLLRKCFGLTCPTLSDGGLVSFWVC